MRDAQQIVVNSIFASNSINTIGEFNSTEMNDRFRESAQIWMSLMNYLRTGNFPQIEAKVELHLLNANLDKAFLSGHDLKDVGVWGILSSQGGELYGANERLTTSNVTYFKLAQNAWSHMLGGWNERCGGGIQASTTDPSKVTYTNIVFAYLSAELYTMSNNQTYKEWADKTYNWLVSSGLVKSNFQILGGIVGNNCNNISHDEHSDNPGLLMGTLASLYQTTPNNTDYLNRLSNLVKSSLQRFTIAGVLFEFQCQGSKNGCPLDTKWAQGLYLHGLTEAYRRVATADYKQQIINALEAYASSIGVINKTTLISTYNSLQLMNAVMIADQQSLPQTSTSSTTSGQPTSTSVATKTSTASANVPGSTSVPVISRSQPLGVSTILTTGCFIVSILTLVL